MQQNWDKSGFYTPRYQPQAFLQHQSYEILII